MGGCAREECEWFTEDVLGIARGIGRRIAQILANVDPMPYETEILRFDVRVQRVDRAPGLAGFLDSFGPQGDVHIATEERWGIYPEGGQN